MDAQILIEQAVAHYRLINQFGLEIEQALQKNDLAALPALCAHLNEAQAEAKTRDSDLLSLLRDHAELREGAATKEWLQLMQRIRERNQRLVPHLNSIMAVQRNELHTLKKGASVLQGYRPGSVQTGRRISSSG